MVDRLIERLATNPNDRTNLDSLDSFINLTRAIFSKSKINEKHCEYFKDKFRMNMEQTNYYVTPKQINNVLGNILSSTKGDLLTNEINKLTTKQNDFIDALIEKDKKVCTYIRFCVLYIIII